MNCKKCGFLMEDDARQCPFCRSSVAILDDKSIVSPPYQTKPESIQPTSKATVGSTQTTSSMNSAAYAYPMKWHKFLIYFALIVSGVSYFITAFMYFANSLQSLDAMYMITAAIMSIILGFLALSARSDLAAFKRSGPSKLTKLYVFNALYGVLFMILGSLNGRTIVVDKDTAIVTAVMSMIMILANRVYFKKRADLFYN